MNSELYDNQYKIPEEIINKIRSKLMTTSDTEGIKRGKNLVKSGHCTYQTLKRLKNFFDNFNNQSQSIDQYELAGGEPMKNFIDQTLVSERTRTSTSKENTRDINLPIGKMMSPKFNGIKIAESDGSAEHVGLKKNSLIVIFDDEMRILLLKRSSYEDQWYPNAYSLVGGAVDEGESPDQAAVRELEEETGIKIDKLIEKFALQRNEDSVEHMFITKLPQGYGNDDIVLDKENDGYIWVTFEEIEKMNPEQLVPNLLDYIRIAVTNYD